MLIDIKIPKIFKDLKMPDLIKTAVLHLVSQGKSHKKRDSAKTDINTSSERNLFQMVTDLVSHQLL